ncbi:MAG: DsbA family oxidoreductase [Rhodospirillaceae bacterium]
MSGPITIEVFSDYVCPWCYLGDNKIKKLKDAYDIDIELVHFPLHPETPAEGCKLQDLFGSGPEEIATKNANMHRMMAAEGLPFNDRSHTYNSRLAQEVGKWAETQEGGDAIHDKFFEAYFVEGRNVGDVDVILDVVKKAGLDVDAAKMVIEDRAFKDAIDQDWAKSHQYGVTGVPTFVAPGPDGQLRGVVGAQPYEVLEQLMAEAGAKKKSA